jgi:ADP-heptose:LPS heptosyltransferase
LNIAILNLKELDELNYTIDCLKFIDTEIIDANIDIFTGYDFSDTIKNSYIRNLFKLDISDIKVADLSARYSQIRSYSRFYKYDIAIDTECSFKTAIIAYLLSGKTAGFKKRGFLGYVISKFYDEIVPYDKSKDKKELTFELLKKVFGFENTYIIE